MKSQTLEIKRMMTQADLAELLALTEWGVWAMRKRGELPPAVRVGRCLRWRPEVIEAWLLERERPAEEFDPVLRARSEKAVEARFGKKQGTAPASSRRRGRPTKPEQVEGRGSAA